MKLNKVIIQPINKMASEIVLKKLLEAAKGSVSFAGMKEEDIWQACQAYADRPDADVEEAIKRIGNKEVEMKNAADAKAKHLQELREQGVALHEREARERLEDIAKAESMLDQLFK